MSAFEEALAPLRPAVGYGDFLTLAGAHALAAAIERFWGGRVTCRIETMTAGRMAIYVVRSNLGPTGLPARVGLVPSWAEPGRPRPRGSLP